MSNHEIEEKDEGIEIAKRMAEEEEGIGRKPKGWQKYVIPTVAVCWSFFQLSIASWLILDSTFIRAIHLGFALLIVFLNYPLFKKTRFGLKYFSAKDRIPILDYAVGIIAALAAVYIVIDYAGLTTRYGAPITRDIVVGITLIVLLLEATRRVIGPALPAIAFLFLIYSFLGPYMPDLIAFKGASLNRLMGQMTMSTEGIYGIPLDVSSTIVFLFVLFGAMLDKAGAGQYFIKLALALLGGYNYWHPYLNDPEKAGVAEMDAAQRAQYQAVACYFAGEYVATAGLLPKGEEVAPATTSSAAQQRDNTDALGLGLGLGSDQVQQLELPTATPGPATKQADPLGLGLGLGSDEVKAITAPKKTEPDTTRKLLIHAEC